MPGGDEQRVARPIGSNVRAGHHADGGAARPPAASRSHGADCRGQLLAQPVAVGEHYSCGRAIMNDRDENEKCAKPDEEVYRF